MTTPCGSRGIRRWSTRSCYGGRCRPFFRCNVPFFGRAWYVGSPRNSADNPDEDETLWPSYEEKWDGVLYQCSVGIALKRRHDLDERMRLGLGRDRQVMDRTSAEALAMQARCYTGLLRERWIVR